MTPTQPLIAVRMITVSIEAAIELVQRRALEYSNLFKTKGFISQNALEVITDGLQKFPWGVIMLQAGLWKGAPVDNFGKFGWRIKKISTSKKPNKAINLKDLSDSSTVGVLMKSGVNVPEPPLSHARDQALDLTPLYSVEDDLKPPLIQIPPPTGIAPEHHGRKACRDCREILTLLNDLAGRKFTGSGDGLRFLHARLSESGRDAVERVVRRKTFKWLGTDSEDFLRPETLFRPTKFDAYANETMPEPTGRKFDPNSPADQVARAKLAERHGAISATRRAAGISYLEFTINEVTRQVDRIVPEGADAPPAEDLVEVERLSAKLEDLRQELAYLREVKPVRP